MEQVSRDRFVNELEDFDAAVLQTPHIDRFCSSSFWQVPALVGLTPNRALRAIRWDDNWLVLAQGKEARFGVYYEPLEASWGFGSPIIGNSEPSVMGVAAEAALYRLTEGHLTILTGLSTRSAFTMHFVDALKRRWRVQVGRLTRRCVASLEGGFSGFVSRRSANFRRNLRRAEKDFERAGLTVEVITACPFDQMQPLVQRILAVEAVSWKGRTGQGINLGAMRAFYEEMLPRLAADGRLRVLFAQKGEEVVAYHFGAVHDDTYRGLQHSYVEDWKHTSAGTVLHARAIEMACNEALPRYDLGQAIAYKRRWSESIYETMTLFTTARRLRPPGAPA